jgi:hypothetical protein
MYGLLLNSYSPFGVRHQQCDLPRATRAETGQAAILRASFARTMPPNGAANHWR